MTDHEHNHECRNLLSSLSDYVDGDVDETVCREIESHMAHCENCRVVVNTLTKTVELYQSAPSPDLPSDVRERLYTTLSLDDLLNGRGKKPPTG